MGLDIYLKNGENYVFEANITHNLVEMADNVGLFGPMWHPYEHGKLAKDIKPLLLEGLHQLLLDPEFCRQFSPKNGWGTYENLLETVKDYIVHCELYPEAEIFVSL